MDGKGERGRGGDRVNPAGGAEGGGEWTGFPMELSRPRRDHKEAVEGEKTGLATSSIWGGVLLGAGCVGRHGARTRQPGAAGGGICNRAVWTAARGGGGRPYVRPPACRNRQPAKYD